ncbi:MAG: 3'-5' exonuclease [Gammaproteobacteria bacterium]
MNVMVFDIETVPDVEAGRRIYDLGDLSDADTAKAMFHLRQEKTGSEFLAHHLHRIVTISVVLRSGKDLRVWSLGNEDAPEPELIQRFFDGLDRYLPTLVSWNGGGFDLPVLHYRTLHHGIAAPRYWETGDDDTSFRYNNYLNRFHWRHLDLMDVLSGYQGRAVAPLDEVATMLGFPGKMGMSGAKVWDAYQAGDIAGIRNYCETDVLNTYLVYLRFELMRGRLTAAAYESECDLVRNTLESSGLPHLTAFAEAWQAGAAA